MHRCSPRRIAPSTGRSSGSSSSPSSPSQNRRHFWALVPFHYGIVVVLTGHVVAFLLPRQLLLWNGEPVRRLVLEIAALACGLLTLFGIVGALARRLAVSKARRVTSSLDWIVIALLTAEVAAGIAVASARARASATAGAVSRSLVAVGLIALGRVGDDPRVRQVCRLPLPLLAR